MSEASTPMHVCRSHSFITLCHCVVTILFHAAFIFLQTPLGLDYKDCLIVKNEHYSLPGVQKSFSSLRELTNYYHHTKLLLAEVPVKLARCCPPRPKGLIPQAIDKVIQLDIQCYTHIQ